VIQIFFFQKLI